VGEVIVRKHLSILKEEEEVVIEKNQLIYQIFLRCDGDYEYNVFDLTDFIPGDVLNVHDGGTIDTIEDVAEFLKTL
jgi:membrane protease subunit (stomatin/prohibitin family)